MRFEILNHTGNRGTLEGTSKGMAWGDLSNHLYHIVEEGWKAHNFPYWELSLTCSICWKCIWYSHSNKNQILPKSLLVLIGSWWIQPSRRVGTLLSPKFNTRKNPLLRADHRLKSNSAHTRGPQWDYPWINDVCTPQIITVFKSNMKRLALSKLMDLKYNFWARK